MKLVLVGDTHGFFNILPKIADSANPNDIIVQVGDLGFWPQLRKAYTPPSRPIHFLEGNHDHIPSFKGITEITELWPNLYYIPRGTVLSIGGKSVGFCGGASSVDYKSRTLGHDWFLDEAVTEQDVARFKGLRVDLLVTHSPPVSAIKASLDPAGLLQFGLTTDWVDHSAVAIESLWTELGYPPLIAGHLHQTIQWRNVRILDIQEVYTIDLDHWPYDAPQSL